MSNREISNITIQGKEVAKITTLDGNGVLYTSSLTPCMELTVTEDSFSTYSSTPFGYKDNLIIDWGDGSGLVEYTGGKLRYYYNDMLNSHTIKIFGEITSLGDSCFYGNTDLTKVNILDGVTSLGMNCFKSCGSLTSVNIPDSVTSLGDYCFQNCRRLTSIYLNWTNSQKIIQYNSSWISNDPTFYIPIGMLQEFIDAGYPSDKLEEI